MFKQFKPFKSINLELERNELNLCNGLNVWNDLNVLNWRSLWSK